MIFIFLMIIAIAFIVTSIILNYVNDEDYNDIYSISGFLMYLGFIIGCLSLILFALFVFC